ncbi:MAG: phosphoribosylamine--glycine ligase [Alphaproteobacteria bacterium]|jgi:phosphoribosylamine--glycine ligase|nr:phosphoribosylamine--glycine ligase [Alphaproteobacteria bacterium]
MNVLVVGSGGREHALCWSIAASPLCTKLFCAPGNGGIAAEATCVDIAADDLDGLIVFARDTGIEFVVVGPEAPLAAGLVDRLEAAGINAFGPTAAAAQLEASKGFARDLCRDHGIPGPDYARFTDAAPARDHLRAGRAPVVVKADGLAAGKGVTVAATIDEALGAVDAIAEGRFGGAGAGIVVEECLAGEEVSIFALVDGVNLLPLVGAQDHKRVGDGDTGPNTGGMGAYSPAPILTSDLERRILDEIMAPTVRAMAAEGRPFKGVLYAGLMITADGPKVLEYNVRFGDPECQVLLARLKSDLLSALVAAHDGELAHFDLHWRPDSALCVVMAADGYPGAYGKGSVIRGLDGLEGDQDVIVFHAGTRLDGETLLAAGGRVLGVTALGPDLAAAQARAYAAVARIDWPEGFCRSDIGWRAISR